MDGPRPVASKTAGRAAVRARFFDGARALYDHAGLGHVLDAVFTIADKNGNVLSTKQTKYHSNVKERHFVNMTLADLDNVLEFTFRAGRDLRIACDPPNLHRVLFALDFVHLDVNEFCGRKGFVVGGEHGGGEVAIWSQGSYQCSRSAAGSRRVGARSWLRARPPRETAGACGGSGGRWHGPTATCSSRGAGNGM